ncbi:MAG: OmpA family protein [Candidatus Kapabacteria bacterium]|nr:OmpA family protein [Candidatus Kapabacteria bacterium]
MRFLLPALILATVVGYAQTYTETLGVRLNGGLIFSTHSGAVQNTAPIIDCGELTSGSGVGPAFSLGLEFPFAPSIGLGVELGYSNRSGTFSRVNEYPMRDSLTGNDVTLLANHELIATLNYVEISPSIIIPIIGSFDKRTLGFSIGPRFALPVAKSYVQQETVTSPSNGVFIVDGKRTQERTIAQGELISPSSMLFGVSASLESFISVGEHIALIPRLSADYFFTNVVTDAEWKLFGVRAEIGIRWSSGSTSQPAPPPPAVGVVAPVYVPPRIALQIFGFRGEVVTGNELRASTPIVNAVFFDSSSADIPLSYRRSIDGSTVSTDPVAAHAWVMSRVANVVKANADARIILEGATSGTTTEPEGIALAQRRAESVRRVLEDMGVSRSSITIKSSVLPRIASNSDFAGGREENRRVDIIVQNAPLQRWVSAEEFAFARGTVNVRASFSGGAPDARPDSMVITTNGHDTVLQLAQVESGQPVDIAMSPTQASVKISLMASAGGAISQRDTVLDVAVLPRRSIAMQAGNFDAVLRFDYNSSDLSEDVKGLLRQLGEQLPPNSTIVVEGSADVLGSEERNRVLSEQRAGNTENFMTSVANKKLNYQTSTRTDKYSDDTPQGRFLNRSIHIRVLPAK